MTSLVSWNSDSDLLSSEWSEFNESIGIDIIIWKLTCLDNLSIVVVENTWSLHLPAVEIALVSTNDHILGIVVLIIHVFEEISLIFFKLFVLELIAENWVRWSECAMLVCSIFLTHVPVSFENTSILVDLLSITVSQAVVEVALIDIAIVILKSSDSVRYPFQDIASIRSLCCLHFLGKFRSFAQEGGMLTNFSKRIFSFKEDSSLWLLH